MTESEIKALVEKTRDLYSEAENECAALVQRFIEKHGPNALIPVTTALGCVFRSSLKMAPPAVALAIEVVANANADSAVKTVRSESVVTNQPAAKA